MSSAVRSSLWSSQPRPDPMLETLSALLRAIAYAAALTGSGIVLAGVTLRVERSASMGFVQGISRWAGAALALAALLSAGVYGLRLGAGLDLTMLSAIFCSPLGTALALQCIAGACLASGPRRRVAAFAAMLILLSFANSGHAPSRSPVAAAAIYLHVSAAAWWIGAICILRATSPVMPPTHFLELLHRFSTQALLAVASLVIAGSIVAAYLLRLDPDLARPYDRLLLFKLGLASALIALAAINKWVLTPALTESTSALPMLQRSMAMELVLFAAVAATTAALTTYLSPH